MKRFRIVFVCWVLIVAQLSRPTEAEAFAWLAAAPSVAPLAAVLAVGAATYYSAPENVKAGIRNAYTDGYYAVQNGSQTMWTKLGFVLDLARYTSSALADRLRFPKTAELADAASEYVPDAGSTYGMLTPSYQYSVTVDGILWDHVCTFGGFFPGQASAWASAQAGLAGWTLSSPSVLGTNPQTYVYHPFGAPPGVTFSPQLDATIWGYSFVCSTYQDVSTRRSRVYYTVFPAATAVPMTSTVISDKFSTSLNSAAAADPAVRDEARDIIAANPANSHAVATNPADVDNPPLFVPPTAEEIAAQAAKIAAQIIADSLAAVEAELAANPTDPDLKLRRDMLLAEQAKADAAAAAADAAVDEAPPATVPPAAAPAPDADVAIDLSPLLGLKDRALSKFPFSTIAGLSGFFGSLIATPTAPAFSLPMPFGLQPYNLSLSSLDGIAEKWRLALAFFFHAGCIYAIIRRYS